MSLPPTRSVNHNLRQLPLRPSSIQFLEQRGFTTTRDMEESKRLGGMSNLASELGCDLVQAAKLWKEVEQAVQSLGSTTHAPNKTALSILSEQQQQRQQRNIVTFCQDVDRLLGGGVSKSEVTEVVGLPGVGKTQLAMQLCVDARLPVPHGGVAGESIYIDSEGSFSPERCYTMAQELVSHVQARIRTGQSQQPLPEWFRADSILQGIHVYRVHDETAQTATIHSLPTFLKERASQGTPVRLLIVDSIAFHYRCTIKDYMARTRSLTSVAAKLSELAMNFDLAVVVVNQMTTKFETQSDSSSGGSATNNITKFVPALGESWAHATTTRIILSHAHDRHGAIRRCELVKSPHRAPGSALYEIRQCGIRDVSNNLKSDNASTRTSLDPRNDPPKRQRL